MVLAREELTVNWLILIRRQDWRYNLTKLVPVPMRITYEVIDGDSTWREHASWVQWRGRILRHRITPLA